MYAYELIPYLTMPMTGLCLKAMCPGVKKQH